MHPASTYVVGFTENAEHVNAVFGVFLLLGVILFYFILRCLVRTQNWCSVCRGWFERCMSESLRLCLVFECCCGINVRICTLGEADFRITGLAH